MSKNRRILVIDDNPSIHADFRNILSPETGRTVQLEEMETTLFGDKVEKTAGITFDLDCASQGQEGYEMVKAALAAGRPYATAFVDIRMPPGWDGIETIEHIWADYPQMQVVICTAFSDYSWSEIMKKLGHSDQLLILKKPFDTIEVVQMALAMTEKWHLTNQSRAHIEEVEKKVIERTRDLQEFTYGVSHDLQEPLRKVIAFGDRLRDKYGPGMQSEALEFLNRMQDAATRMSCLITDLLALSRVTTQAKPCAPVDLNAIVSDVLSDLEVRIEQVKGTVKVGRLPTIQADRTQMRQLFQNLIGNALKFRKKDLAPVINVEAATASKSDWTGESSSKRWQITVRDNGIGFDEKYRDQIFEVFQRLHNRNEYEGSGIGLALCRKIASRHGGSISAYSKPGEGATFQIILPERHQDTEGENTPAITDAQTATASTGEQSTPATTLSEPTVESVKA